jgi:elongation factor P
MITADKAFEGLVIKREGALYKVLEVGFGGTAQRERVVHLKLRNLRDGTQSVQTLSAQTLLEDVHLQKRTATFMYKDRETFYFMDDETYEELAVRKEVVGNVAPYLKEQMRIELEMDGADVVNILFPKVVQLRVIQAPAPIHAQGTTAMKEATLENGITLLVPQFIKEGDIVKVDVATGRYIERVQK